MKLKEYIKFAVYTITLLSIIYLLMIAFMIEGGISVRQALIQGAIAAAYLFVSVYTVNALDEEEELY